MIPPARYDVPLIRVLLTDSNGNPVTGIANNDANLRIAICRDSVGSIAVFSGGNILSITTIGAYSDPGSSVQCRWGEVNSTYFPGLYELQFNQSFWAAARASLIVRVYDATGTPRWVQVYAAIPCYMPTRVDHVRDTLQTARDLGAQLDVAVSTRSTLTASDVWSHATRTLTSFGTLVSDVASAVWSAGARTLTSFGTLASDVWSSATRTLTSYADSAGVTTLLSRLTSQRATNLDNLDATVSSRAAPGSAMTLTSGERTAIAQAVLSQPAVGTLTTAQVLTVLEAVLAGKAENTGTGSRFRDIADTKWVVTVVHDVQGNRTSVTLDP